MIPQSTGWQYLRSLSLDAIPTGTKVFYTRAVALHEWRRNGAFTVVSCTKKEVVLEAAAVEIGAALLSDTEYLLDHAAEHRATLHDAVIRTTWHSPAWTLVTTYYWAFFSILALTRMTGRSVWFLDKAAIAELKSLASAADQPGAGALNLSLEPYISSTIRRIHLHPSNTQLHDAVWRTAHHLISDVFGHADKSNLLEYQLWQTMKAVGDKFGADWPSKLRNAVNYRPGYGYREVTQLGQIDMAHNMRLHTPGTINQLLNTLEQQAIAVQKLKEPSEDPRLFSQILGTFAIMVSAILETLHAEVLDRQGSDRRWRTQRNRFLTERCRTSMETVWPFSE